MVPAASYPEGDQIQAMWTFQKDEVTNMAYCTGTRHCDVDKHRSNGVSGEYCALKRHGYEAPDA